MKSTPRILIADDDLDDLELLEEALIDKQPDIYVEKVNSGKSALALLSNYGNNMLPQLIILDYNMPEVSGSDILAHLCRDIRYKNIPKVIFSTSNALAHREECLGNGATDYIVKPNTKQQLDQVARKMLSLIH
jgi:CheY-like chemotaxis protein